MMRSIVPYNTATPSMDSGALPTGRNSSNRREYAGSIPVAATNPFGIPNTTTEPHALLPRRMQKWNIIMFGRFALVGFFLTCACLGKACDTISKSQPASSSSQTQAQEDTGANPSAPRTARLCDPGNPILSRSRCLALQRKLDAMQPGLDREVAKARQEFIDTATSRQMAEGFDSSKLVPQATPRRSKPTTVRIPPPSERVQL